MELTRTLMGIDTGPPWHPRGNLHTSKFTLECLHPSEDVKVILRAGYMLARFHYCPSLVDPLHYLVLFSCFFHNIIAASTRYVLKSLSSHVDQPNLNSKMTQGVRERERESEIKLIIVKIMVIILLSVMIIIPVSVGVIALLVTPREPRNIPGSFPEPTFHNLEEEASFFVTEVVLELRGRY